MPKIKMFLPMRGCGARIEVDGTELRNVGEITVKARGGDVPEIWLRLVGDVEIEAESEVVAEVIHPKDGQTIPVDLKGTVIQGERDWTRAVIRGDPKK